MALAGPLRSVDALTGCAAMHIHAYTTRYVPPITGGIKPRLCRPEGGEDFRTAPYPPDVLRDWLLRPADRIAATFGDTASALAWFQGWINDNPRPESYWSRYDPKYDDTPPELPCYQRYEQRLRDHAPAGSSWPLFGPQRKLAYAGLELSGGRNVADAFYTATQYVAAYLICCPAPGYRCPLEPT